MAGTVWLFILSAPPSPAGSGKWGYFLAWLNTARPAAISLEDLPETAFAGSFCYTRQRQGVGWSRMLLRTDFLSSSLMEVPGCWVRAALYLIVQLWWDAKPCQGWEAHLERERRKSRCIFYNFSFTLTILVLAGKIERVKKVKLGWQTIPLTFWPHMASFSKALMPRAASGAVGTTWGHDCHRHSLNIKPKVARRIVVVPAEAVRQRQELGKRQA